MANKVNRVSEKIGFELKLGVSRKEMLDFAVKNKIIILLMMKIQKNG